MQHARNIGILVGGTAFSQLIAILILPILTRIYSPEDFSTFAIYTAILSIITVIACLRFEIAIPIPKSDYEAQYLLLMSIISVFFITIVAIFILFIFQPQINTITDNKLDNYLWLIPLGIFLAGLYNTFQYWATRQKNFTLIAKTRMTQSISGSFSQSIIGYIYLSPLGLLIGQIINISSGIPKLIIFFYKSSKILPANLNIQDIKTTLQKYKKFPLYSTFEALADSASIQLPIILIAYYTIGAEVGFLMLALRLLSAPTALISNAIAQIYLADGAKKYHEKKLKQFTYQTVILIAKISIIPFILIASISPYLIPFILGEDWHRTGVIISLMTPCFFLQLLSSPISMALHITNHQKTALVLQVISLIIRVGSIFIASALFSSFFIESYALSSAIFYSIYLIIILYTIREY
nr:oligosaccharide flippase family protein [Wohlfahrtiimonas chitiniclastica]